MRLSLSSHAAEQRKRYAAVSVLLLRSILILRWDMVLSMIAILRSFARVGAPLGAIVIAVSSCQSSGNRAGEDLRQSGRDLTRHLLAGAFDSLPKNAVLDLGGQGDTVLARWFVDRRHESLGREWPRNPLLLLEGLQAGPTFLSRLEAVYGSEVEIMDEASYPCYHPLCELPHSLEYKPHRAILRIHRQYPYNCVAMGKRQPSSVAGSFRRAALHFRTS